MKKFEWQINCLFEGEAADADEFYDRIKNGLDALGLTWNNSEGIEEMEDE